MRHTMISNILVTPLILYMYSSYSMILDPLEKYDKAITVTAYDDYPDHFAPATNFHIKLRKTVTFSFVTPHSTLLVEDINNIFSILDVDRKKNQLSKSYCLNMLVSHALMEKAPPALYEQWLTQLLDKHKEPLCVSRYRTAIHSLVEQLEQEVFNGYCVEKSLLDRATAFEYDQQLLSLFMPHHDHDCSAFQSALKSICTDEKGRRTEKDMCAAMKTMIEDKILPPFLRASPSYNQKSLLCITHYADTAAKLVLILPEYQEKLLTAVLSWAIMHQDGMPLKKPKFMFSKTCKEPLDHKFITKEPVCWKAVPTVIHHCTAYLNTKSPEERMHIFSIGAALKVQLRKQSHDHTLTTMLDAAACAYQDYEDAKEYEKQEPLITYMSTLAHLGANTKVKVVPMLKLIMQMRGGLNDAELLLLNMQKNK